MKVIDPGHSYQVDTYDSDDGLRQSIHFMKREGEGYPGNVGTQAGTNCQELIRVLIDRIKYLDNQISSPYNHIALAGLRAALDSFEVRAAKRHGRKLEGIIFDLIESYETCKICGHIQCGGHSEP